MIHSSLQKMADFLDQNGFLDETLIAYSEAGKFPFTYEEFIAFVETVWDNAGGWRSAKKYRFKPADFRTYFVPFKINKKKYWLCVVQGQGIIHSIYTQEEYELRTKQIRAESRLFEDSDEEDIVCENEDDFEVLNAFQKNILTKNRS
jgi:hypothetical protein